MFTYEVNEPKQFPPFWDEEWLQIAIHELDKHAFTPEQRMVYEMTISANAVAIRNEQKKIQKAQLADKTESVKNALDMGLTLEQSAKLVGVSAEFVENIKQIFLPKIRQRWPTHRRHKYADAPTVGRCRAVSTKSKTKPLSYHSPGGRVWV
jgi:hypothetical protein